MVRPDFQALSFRNPLIEVLPDGDSTAESYVSVKTNICCHAIISYAPLFTARTTITAIVQLLSLCILPIDPYDMIFETGKINGQHCAQYPNAFAEARALT